MDQLLGRRDGGLVDVHRVAGGEDLVGGVVRGGGQGVRGGGGVDEDQMRRPRADLGGGDDGRRRAPSPPRLDLLPSGCALVFY